MRKITPFVALVAGAVTTVAFAADPFTNDEVGVNHSIKPFELTVFLAQVYDKGPWPENVHPAVPGMKNNGWTLDEDGLMQCRRSYVYIGDQSAGGMKPGDVDAERAENRGGTIPNRIWRKVLPLSPDATNITTCARLAMMTPQTTKVGYGVAGVACPQRVLGASGAFHATTISGNDIWVDVKYASPFPRLKVGTFLYGDNVDEGTTVTSIEHSVHGGEETTQITVSHPATGELGEVSFRETKFKIPPCPIRCKCIDSKPLEM